MEDDRERADLAEEAYLQAEEEVEQLKAQVRVLERKLTESEAERAEMWRDVRLLLGEAGVHRVREALVDHPDEQVARALQRYVGRVWRHVEPPPRPTADAVTR